MNVEKLQKMAGSVRTGGKGTMRRKKKCNHKPLPGFDKKLQSTLNKFDFKSYSGFEILEVNIFKDDEVIHFKNPRVQVCLPANTWVVTGSAQTRKLIDILPEMFHQLGHENLEDLQKMIEQRQAPGSSRATLTPLNEDSDDGDVPELGSEQIPRQAPGSSRATLTPLDEDSDDDDMPELVSDDETFEAASERD